MMPLSGLIGWEIESFSDVTEQKACETGDIDSAYLQALQEERSDAAKKVQHRVEDEVVGLHNAT